MEAIELLAYIRENWLFWTVNPKRDPQSVLHREDFIRFLVRSMHPSGRVAWYLEHGTPR